jgi:2-polyprenyl-3-methyl-5-hydroxy-6-metoxy-1,4-benzoquinol methylase
MIKYVHREEYHSVQAPKEIVPVIIKLFNPDNVVDVGCGLGEFLYYFKKHGVEDVLGIDGHWVDKRQIKRHLEPFEFQEHDLENKLELERYYDLVISLEVAEHLPPASANAFVQNLISAGKLIVFSAAIPTQGGQNHQNEQWLTYWVEKFSKYNYKLHDIIRPLIWDNEKIHWWYRQNIVLFAPENYRPPSNLLVNPIQNIVHYDLLLERSEYAEQLKNLITMNPLVRLLVRWLLKGKPGNRF